MKGITDSSIWDGEIGEWGRLRSCSCPAYYAVVTVGRKLVAGRQHPFTTFSIGPPIISHMAAQTPAKGSSGASPASRTTSDSIALPSNERNRTEGVVAEGERRAAAAGDGNSPLPPCVEALLRFAALSPAANLELDVPALRAERSQAFFQGALEMYRLAQDAMSLQLKGKIERIREVRKLRVKARRMSIKITKLLKS